MKTSFLAASVSLAGAMARVGFVKTPGTNADQFQTGLPNSALPVVVFGDNCNFFVQGKTYDFTVTETAAEPTAAAAGAPTVETLAELQQILFQAYKSNYDLLDSTVKTEISNVMEIGDVLKTFIGQDETEFFAAITAKVGQELSDAVKDKMLAVLEDMGWTIVGTDSFNWTGSFLSSLIGVFDNYRERVIFEFKTSLLVRLYSLPLNANAASIILTMHDNYQVN